MKKLLLVSVSETIGLNLGGIEFLKPGWVAWLVSQSICAMALPPWLNVKVGGSKPGGGTKKIPFHSVTLKLTPVWAALTTAK